METDEREQALAELQAARRRYRRAFVRSTALWRPLIPFTNIWINARGLAYLWTTAHLLAFVVGVVLSLVGEPVRDLGFALVVGSLFASGALWGQLWAVAFQREKQLLERTVGPNFLHEDLDTLGAELRAAMDRVANLGGLSGDGQPISRMSIDQIRSRLDGGGGRT